MIHLRRPLHHAALGTLILLSGCSHSLLDRSVEKGVIEYALSFPDYDPDGLMSGMLPERTTLTFDKNMQVAELSAGMGVFRTTMICDNNARNMDYHLSILSKKLVSHLQERDMSMFTGQKGGLTILFTQQMDTIAGYPCRKAVAISSDITVPETEVWYTDRIAMNTPNWFGPFADVPGVLLRYEVVQYGMRMRLEAIAVTPGNVDPSKFAVKQDHEKVAPEVLQYELQEVLSTFSL